MTEIQFSQEHGRPQWRSADGVWLPLFNHIEIANAFYMGAQFLFDNPLVQGPDVFNDIQAAQKLYIEKLTEKKA